MTLSEALKKRIMDLAEERKMSLHKLTTVSGVAYSTLSSFFLGKCSSLTLTTILHICEGLNIKLKDFFDDPVFKDITISETKISK